MSNDARITTLDDETPIPAPTLGKKKAVAAAEVVTDAAPATVDANGMSGKKVEITIHQGEGDMGREDIFVGINGYAYQIKRGERVTVPVEVKEVIENALTIHQEYTKAGVVERKVPRHTMSVHGFV